MDKHLYNNLCELSAQDAILILIKEFGEDTNLIMFKGTKRVVSLRDLAKEYTNCPSVLATQVSPINFRGGPPGWEDYFDGSLLTMLCDRVLKAWHLRGEYEDLVESEVTWC